MPFWVPHSTPPPPVSTPSDSGHMVLKLAAVKGTGSHGSRGGGKGRGGDGDGVGDLLPVVVNGLTLGGADGLGLQT